MRVFQEWDLSALVGIVLSVYVPEDLRNDRCRFCLELAGPDGLQLLSNTEPGFLGTGSPILASPCFKWDSSALVGIDLSVYVPEDSE